MKRLVFLTGAGISAESGITTFRDSGGLWEQYPVMQVASIEGYEKDPALVIKFYNERRRQLLEVQPNDAHRLVAELERQYDVTVVTQNVDNLHERAGSTHIIHLHGELMKATSTYAPNDPQQLVTLSPDHLDIQMGDRAKDGSQLRPFIEPAAEAVQQADILVIIGTSLNVYPAAGLVHYARPGCRIYLIDPHPAEVAASLGIHVIAKGASEGMKDLVELLK